MAQFCYSTPYLGIETVSCCLLQRMVRMGIQKIETNAMSAFCVWVKALDNDFSTEWTQNSNIIVT